MFFILTLGITILLVAFVGVVYAIKEKKWIVLLPSAIGFACGIAFLIYYSDHDRYDWMLYVALGLFAAAVLAIVLPVVIRRKKKATEDARNREAAEKEQAIRLYRDSYVRGVFRLDRPEDLKKLRIIAGSLGIEDLEAAKEIYARGKVLYEEKEKADQKAAKEREEAEKTAYNADAHLREFKQYCEDLKKAEAVGKQKYRYTFYHAGPKGDEPSMSYEEVAKKLYTYRAPQRDWAIEGGLASGIGGIGPGLMAAASAQKYNAEMQEYQSAVNELGIQMMIMKDQNARRKKTDSEKKAEDNRREAESRNLERDVHVERAVCDVLDPEEKFALLSFSNWSFSRQDSGNVLVTADCKAGEALLFNIPAVLDGSLGLKVKDKSGKVLAEGVYLAPGFDENRLEKVGFANVRQIRCTCIAKDPGSGEIRESIKNLTCEVTPIRMWTIEK